MKKETLFLYLKENLFLTFEKGTKANKYIAIIVTLFYGGVLLEVSD
jgi:hypothetical protein